MPVKNPNHPRTYYPGAIDKQDPLTSTYVDAIRTKVNNVDKYNAEDVNVLQDAVLAIQETAGVNPQGTRADIASRLNVSMNLDGSLKSTPPNGMVITGASTLASLSGKTITHNIGHVNYRVLITPTADPKGYLGEFWVLKQANTFVVYNSGSAVTAFDWEVRY